MVETRRPVVCQVLHSLNVGGAELLARDFALHSAERCTTVFACIDEIGTLGRQLLEKGLCVRELGRRSGFDYRLSRKLAKFCRENRVSVIHAHQYAPFFYSALSRLPWGGPPILFTEHGRSFPDFRRPKRVLANKFLIRRRDRIVAVGRHVRKALIENEGIPAARVEVIYNGIDLDLYSPSSNHRATTRRQLGLSETDVVAIQVARLDPLKDHATAIRAMNRLKDTHPNIHLLVVGEGETLPEIECAIRNGGIQQTVHLLGLRHDVAALLRAADIFLLTSVSEGIPLTLIEAMATGLPCVATAVGGVSEVVVDGQSGLLAAAQDDAAVARHLTALATDEPRRRQMGKCGCQRAHSMFSDRQMHAAYQHLYQEMASNVASFSPIRKQAHS